MRAGGAELVCVQTSCIRCAEGGGRWCVCVWGGRFCACLFYWSPRDWWWAIHGTSRQILPASARLGHSESEWLALPNDSQTCAQRWQRMCPLGQRAQGPSAATQEGGGVCGELSIAWLAGGPSSQTQFRRVRVAHLPGPAACRPLAFLPPHPLKSARCRQG